MVQRYPGLIVKGRTFFFRVAVPRKYWTIARCKEIGYSLNTSDYKIAVARWRTEIAHLQTFMNVFEDIIMKINDNKQLTLDENDVDKVLLARLGQIQYFLEENSSEIVLGKKKFEDIKLPEEKNRQSLMSQMIVEYLKGLVDNNKANITLRTVYSKLRDKEVELGIQTKTEDGYEWFKSFTGHVQALERYAQNSIKAIKKDKPYSPSNPKVKTLLDTYDAIKTNERINRSMTRTHWEKFFKKFARNKRNLKGTCEERLYENYRSVKLSFLLIEKDYIEDITKQDCRRLSEKVYQVPKRWHVDVVKGKPLNKILTTAPTRVLGKKTIKGILETFNEFMRFAVKEEIINYNLNEFVDMPIKLDGQIRTPFEGDELRKIFNPETYPDPHIRTNAAKFWVPIIALYQGARLNEICQMDLDDIVLNKKIPCFSINANGKDKTLKNKGSERIIPIHPKLIEMGFLSYVEYQRKRKEKKLFSCLNQIKRGRYSRTVQAWFARHLDELHMSGKDKVFHSFRYTFETKAVEKKIPTEYQNALGGWVDYGVGQRIYGKKKDIKVLLEEISKISYPIHKELKGLEEQFRDSYVFRW
ncbi:MAG: site-specific integrase [Alphaproteobacteria bacterium]|nr:site-specific integrase [Alphaproteobacteria bacterium]